MSIKSSLRLRLSAALVCAALGALLLGGSPKRETETHWAYQPLRSVSPPEAMLTGWERWARTPIDQFVLRKLSEHALHPSSAADRRTLLRRVYFDLIGMLPTAEEIDGFATDDAPDAYERVVDRLLASPRHGERWARHWMDVVHFAETHGHDQDRPREHAWPYRDYLIQSFNEDKPYARFVEEQVAGDVLRPDDPSAVVATGFIAAGPWDESSLMSIQSESIDRLIGQYLDRDDIVTTTMATFVSASVQCARCHAHKFDPISQDEYYSLQAVFAGIDKANRPYDPDPVLGKRRRELRERLARIREQRKAADVTLLEPNVIAEVAAWETKLKGRNAEWHVLKPVEHKSAGGATLTTLDDGSVLSGGERPDKDTYTVTCHTDQTGITGVRLELLTHESLPHKGPGRQPSNGNVHLNEFRVAVGPRVEAGAADAPAREAAKPKPVQLLSPRADFEQHNYLVSHAIDSDTATSWAIHPQTGKPHRAVFVTKESIGNNDGATLTFELAQVQGGGHLVGRFRVSVTTSLPPFGVATLPTRIVDILSVARDERDDRQRVELAGYVLEQRLRDEFATLPEPSYVFCGTRHFRPDGGFMPAEKPRPIHVLARGNVKNPEAVAKPGSLSLIPRLTSAFQIEEADNEGARRLALARWLTNSKNVLTWRSIVNRLWQHHFGRGIVDTPSEFGRMGSKPTHPELLDWLASRLLEGGGSLKAVHREIVTSAAYQQSSGYDSPLAEVDAGNRYLWRMHRRRLDAESIRDAVLRVSGKLDTRMGGPSVKQFIQSAGIHVTPKVDYINFNVDDPANYRRSIYRFIFRTLPDPFMEALDCPDASVWSPTRTESLTALHALSMLNDKFIVRQSEHVAERAESAGADLKAHVERAYRLILARRPSEDETAAVTAYAEKHGLANACRYLINSNEFMFVD